MLDFGETIAHKSQMLGTFEGRKSFWLACCSLAMLLHHLLWSNLSSARRCCKSHHLTSLGSDLFSGRFKFAWPGHFAQTFCVSHNLAAVLDAPYHPAHACFPHLTFTSKVHLNPGKKSIRFAEMSVTRAYKKETNLNRWWVFSLTFVEDMLPPSSWQHLDPSTSSPFRRSPSAK